MIREAPPKPRDSLLVNPQQFEDQYSKLRIVFLTYLKSNKEWNGDFRNETKTEQKLCWTSTMSHVKTEAMAKAKARKESSTHRRKLCYARGKKGHSARDCWSRDASHPERIVNVEFWNKTSIRVVSTCS